MSPAALARHGQRWASPRTSLVGRGDYASALGIAPAAGRKARLFPLAAGPTRFAGPLPAGPHHRRAFPSHLPAGPGRLRLRPWPRGTGRLRLRPLLGGPGRLRLHPWHDGRRNIVHGPQGGPARLFSPPPLRSGVAPTQRIRYSAGPGSQVGRLPCKGRGQNPPPAETAGPLHGTGPRARLAAHPCPYRSAPWPVPSSFGPLLSPTPL